MLNNIILASFLVIILFGIAGVFLSRRAKDRCLADFRGFLTTVLHKNGKRVWGHLLVEPSGIELKYQGNYWDQDHVETSFILYKEELGGIHILFRYHDELSEEARNERQRDIDKSYHPSLPFRLVRHARNAFSSLKDPVLEAGNVLIQAMATNPAFRTVATQQKAAAISFAGASYDPLLERHIGTMVVVEVTSPDGTVDEYVGIFKEYSAQFLEVMDVHVHEGETSRMCDMIIPRAHAAIRHSAEPVPERARKAEGREPLSPAAGDDGGPASHRPMRHGGLFPREGDPCLTTSPSP